MNDQNAQPAARKSLKGTKVGVVTSDKRDKTRTVAVDYSVQHSKYGKYLRRSTQYQVHDPSNDSHAGDRVEIATCRPISKTKSWRLVRVVERAPGSVQIPTGHEAAESPQA